MLTVTLPATEGEEFWDEGAQQFILTPAKEEQTLTFEHSLASISEWESKWCKPFFSKVEKTQEETVHYLKCMTLTKNVESDIYDRLTNDQNSMNKIYEYINAPMTATTFSNTKSKKGGHEIITAEIIYYWMVANNIPFECQYWHINKLITLIRVCGEKNSPGKSMSKNEIMRRNAALNAARRKRFNSKG